MGTLALVTTKRELPPPWRDFLLLPVESTGQDGSSSSNGGSSWLHSSGLMLKIVQRVTSSVLIGVRKVPQHPFPTSYPHREHQHLHPITMEFVKEDVDCSRTGWEACKSRSLPVLFSSSNPWYQEVCIGVNSSIPMAEAVNRCQFAGVEMLK